MSKIVVGVAGGAKVTKRNVRALLSDFFKIDQDDEDEFLVYLPVTEELVTDAVEHTADWLYDINGGYAAVHEDPPPRKLRGMVADADDAYPCGDMSVAEKLIELLQDEADDADAVYLFLAWGENDLGPDDATRELVNLAMDAGIPVKDLAMGLVDLVDDEEPEPEPEPEPEEVPEDKPKARELKPKVKELKPAPDEAQADMHKISASEDTKVFEENIPDLVTVLAFVAQKLDHEDRMNAANHMVSVQYRPLTIAVRHHLKILLDQKDKPADKPEKAAEPVQETLPEPEPAKPAKKRGKPRDVNSDDLIVYVNDSKRTLKVYGGRGRPPQTGTRTEMTRAEYAKLLEEGYTEA